MKLFLYYAGHALINQIKKLMKTYIAIFAVIFLVAAIFGFIAGSVTDENEDIQLGSDSEVTDTAESDTEAETQAEAETQSADVSDGEITTANETAIGILRLVSGAVILLVIAWGVLGADKNGSGIFLMGDVNLLFQAPLKPQSVLLFRLIFKMGALAAASVYLLFQIPNLCINVGISVGCALSLIGGWIFALIFSQLLSVLIYTVTATHLQLRKYVTPVFIGVCAAAALAFAAYWKSSGADPFTASLAFFNSKAAIAVPIWGWVKGIIDFASLGDFRMMLVMIGVCVIGCAVLIAIIWNIKADFYEDAMAKSEETAALMEARQSAGKSFMQRKKDRSEKIHRNGNIGGSGASVLFFRDMYNRRRFAHFGFITSASVVYLLIALAAVLVARYAGYQSVYPAVILLVATAYFKAFGNPLAKDISNTTFLMMPSGCFAKLLFPILSEAANAALDLLPATVVVCILVPAEIPQMLLGALMALTLDVASSCAGVLADLSLPESISKGVKTVIQVLFVYIGMIPMAALIIVGMVRGSMLLTMSLAVALNLLISAVALAIAPGLIKNGRR